MTGGWERYEGRKSYRSATGPVLAVYAGGDSFRGFARLNTEAITMLPEGTERVDVLVDTDGLRLALDPGGDGFGLSSDGSGMRMTLAGPIRELFGAAEPDQNVHCPVEEDGGLLVVDMEPLRDEAMNPCGDCDRWFETKGGLATHRNKAHLRGAEEGQWAGDEDEGEPEPVGECVVCGDECYPDTVVYPEGDTKKERPMCSLECWKEDKA